MLDRLIGIKFMPFGLGNGTSAFRSYEGIRSLGHFSGGVKSQHLIGCWLAGNEARDFYGCCLR